MSLLGGLLGAAGGFLTGGPAGAAIGGLSGLSGTGSKLNKQGQRYLGQAGNIAQGQQGLFNTAVPAQQDLLNFYRNYATGGGLYHNPTANGQQQLGASNSQLGIFNDPADALRLSQANEDINRFAKGNARNLQSDLGMRGVASATRDAVLGQNRLSALQDYGNFRRQLAINAPHEQAARMGQLAQYGIQPGLGAGQEAAGLYSSLGGSYLGQGQSYNQGIGQTIGNLGYLDALKQYGNQGQKQPWDLTHFNSSNLGTDWYIGPNGEPIRAYARGGSMQAGQAGLVGENGPEVFVPMTDGQVIPHPLYATLSHLAALQAMRTQ
jgi:hypothetical protein